MTTPSAGSLVAALLVLQACGGTDPGPTGEVVVSDATRGAGTVTILGVSDAIYWSVTSSTTRLVEGASLATLPAAAGQELGTAAGPVAYVRDHVLIETGDAVLRTGIGMTPSKLDVKMTDALGEGPPNDPTLVWTAREVVSWGTPGGQVDHVVLPHVVRCPGVLVTAAHIYLDVDGTAERRLWRIDRATKLPTAVAGSMALAASFPGGAVATADYTGRLITADDRGAIWLVEETQASKVTRSIVVSVPLTGEPHVLLANVTATSAFFADGDELYWQEDDALLTAPRAGGAASIAGYLPATAGAIAAGFVYYAQDNAILRSSLDAL